MLPILRRVQWKARISTHGAIPFRPSRMAWKSEQVRLSHSSSRTSDNRTYDRVSKILNVLVVLTITALVYSKWNRHKVTLYSMVMAHYHRLNGALIHPSYLPIRTAGEIRLLVLEPGKGDDPIRCRLKHVSLSDNPKYEALSYVCGNPIGYGYIYCDGELVRIGKELFDALESLRGPDRERTIWADALCINQSDNIEKGKQVQIMGDIYASSQQVLIWFGKPTSQTAGAFEAVREMDRHFKQTQRGYEDVSLERLADPSEPSLGQVDLQEVFEYDWVAITKLLQHPWHRRVWTLQEVAKAPAATIVHGRESIPASDFLRPTSYTARFVHNPQIPIDYSKAQALGKRSFDMDNFENWSNSKPRPYLYMVASNSPSRGATDPRDRIYAFRSLSTDHNALDLELLPDYDASVEEVYSRFARWCLVKNKDLAYLANAGLPDQHEGPLNGDFPSWVADWTRQTRVDFQDSFSCTLKPFKAGSALKPTVFWKPNQPRLLFIKGRVVDSVAELAVAREDLTRYYKRSARSSQGQKYEIPLWLKLVGLVPVTKRIVQGLQEAQQAVFKYGPVKGPPYMLEEVIWMENCKAIAMQGVNPIPPARFDTFWRAMVRDRTLMGEAKAPRDLGKKFEEYLGFLDLVRRGERWPPFYPEWLTGQHAQPEEPQPKAQVPFIHPPNQVSAVAVSESESTARWTIALFLGRVPHKRFCSTSEDRLGWVPDCAEPGDLICVFDGATVPHVIRPKVEKLPGRFSYEYWRRQLSGYSPLPVESKDNPKYVLVGECYVQGLMDGEALAREDLEPKVITLC